MKFGAHFESVRHAQSVGQAAGQAHGQLAEKPAGSRHQIHVGFGGVGDQPEGARSASDRITGSYLHGLFRDDTFRAAWRAQFHTESTTRYDDAVDTTLDALADHLRQYLDTKALFAAARQSAPTTP